MNNTINNTNNINGFILSKFTFIDTQHPNGILVNCFVLTTNKDTGDALIYIPKVTAYNSPLFEMAEWNNTTNSWQINSRYNTPAFIFASNSCPALQSLIAEMEDIANTLTNFNKQLENIEA